MKRFKVFKKLCSLALILSMLVSMIPINVFATTTEETPEEQPKKTPIIVNNPGSLTINKYEGNDTSKPLNGVTFNVYKIMDIDVEDGDVSYEILDAYKGFFQNKGINSGDELVKKDADVLNGYIPELQEIILRQVIQPDKTETTKTVGDKVGKAVMNDLELGYYLVVEKGHPSQIVEPIAPFFVSIPMTSQNGDEWIYDVEVFPKNQSAYGSVVINKTGNDRVALSGVTFELQKQKWDNFNTPVLDENEQLVWEDVIYKDKDGKEIATMTGTNGKLTFDNLTRGIYRVKETSVGNNNGYILDDSIYYQFEVVWNGEKLQYSYNGQTTDTLTIDVTNEKPEISKQASLDGNDWADDVTSHIGKYVDWKITTTVPSTIEKLKTYTIIDTLSKGLDFDLTTAFESETQGVFVIKNGVTQKLIKETEYTLVVEEKTNDKGEKETVLSFNFIKGVLTGGEEIVIKYNTRLNENAVIAREGNPNKVKLEYSKSTTTDSKTETPEDISRVYTGGVNIFKYHVVEGLETPLAGAEFQIYETKADALAQTNPIKVLVNGDLVTTVTSDAEGIVSFTGLAYGDSNKASKTYWVVETKAPEKFNLLKEPFQVTVNATSHTLDASSLGTEGGITGVLNKKGFILPETGGMGTVIFTVAGLGMMGLAGAAYIALKRKESQQ